MVLVKGIDSTWFVSKNDGTKFQKNIKLRKDFGICVQQQTLYLGEQLRNSIKPFGTRIKYEVGVERLATLIMV